MDLYIDRPENITATIGNFVGVMFKKSSPLKPSSQMNRNLVGST